MIKNNIFIKTCFVFALCFTLLGCESFLNEKPKSSIVPDQFWKTKKDADTWLAGIYNSMQTTLTNNFFDWGEVRSDNVVRVSRSNSASTKLLNNTISANDTDLNSVTSWDNLYSTISLCNFGIKYFPQMASLNIEQQARVYQDYLGQSYGIRALMYFYALRVWGRVPIITEPIESINNQPKLSRSSIADVKARILEDIESSLRYIGNNKARKFYLQKAAVLALKTDVHMWFQEYDEALLAADDCLLESGGTLVTSADQWKQIFLKPESSTETIFNLKWSSVERGAGSGVCAKMASSDNNQYSISADQYKVLADRTTDGRFSKSFDLILFPNYTTYRNTDRKKFAKFSDYNTLSDASYVYGTANDCDVHIPIYRLADILLLKAEALNKKQRYSEALTIVNNIRQRVGYAIEAKESDYSSNKEAQIENLILNERQVEFLGEGKRWFDLCRVGVIFDYTNTGYTYMRNIMNPIIQTNSGVLFSDVNVGRVLYPINSNAFNTNPALRGDQNSPYDE